MLRNSGVGTSPDHFHRSPQHTEQPKRQLSLTNGTFKHTPHRPNRAPGVPRPPGCRLQGPGAPRSPPAHSPAPRARPPPAWRCRSRPAPAPWRGCARRCAASWRCSSPPRSSWRVTAARTDPQSPHAARALPRLPARGRLRPPHRAHWPVRRRSQCSLDVAHARHPLGVYFNRVRPPASVCSASRGSGSARVLLRSRAGRKEAAAAAEPRREREEGRWASWKGKEAGSCSADFLALQRHKHLLPSLDLGWCSASASPCTALSLGTQASRSRPGTVSNAFWAPLLVLAYESNSKLYRVVFLNLV